MNRLPSRRTCFDCGASILSGILLACAFPAPDLSWLAWFSLVPLLLVFQRRPFFHGYLAGIAFFAVTIYWLNIVMVNYGHLHPVLSLFAYLFLVAYLALFFALSTWVCDRLLVRLAYPLVLTLPVVWMAAEMLRAVLLTGFPWVLLGYSQHENLVLVQSADLFGVYGVSGLLAFANVLIASVLAWSRDRQQRFSHGRYLVVFVLLLITDVGYGKFRLAQQQLVEEITVGIVQGNIDQSIKWSPDQQVATVNKYLQLSVQAVEEGAQLLVWPESATPFYFQDSTPLQQAVLALPEQTGTSLLTGSPAYEPKDSQGYHYYNSAFMVNPAGELVGRSDKVHLVPFGEYVPLGQFLPFIDKLVYGIGDFSPGILKTLPYGDRTIGVLVCYEAVFPELARSYVSHGSQLLVNITNDAWFGNSSAPYQHLAMSRFRAIENRRWLVRSANTGFSALIAPDGTVVKQSGLFNDQVITARAGFLDTATFYTRFGDLLPLLSLLIIGAWLWQSRLRK